MDTVLAFVVAHVTVDVSQDTQTFGFAVIESQLGFVVLFSGSHILLHPSVPHPVRDGSFGSHCSLPFRMPSPHTGGGVGPVAPQVIVCVPLVHVHVWVTVLFQILAELAGVL